VSGYSLPPSPAELKKRSDRRRAIWLLTASAIAVFAVGTFVVRGLLTQVALDTETLCPKKSLPAAQIAVLLDVTDTLNEVQRESVLRSFENLQESLGTQAQLSLYALRAPAKSHLQPEVRLCNPGSGEGASWLWENPEKIQRRWERGFRQPLRKLLEETLNSPEARISPIMEQIQAASVTAFDSEVEDRRLIIISDLLQNSEILSMYRGNIDFDEFHLSPAYERVRADLTGVSIQILYLQRSDSPFIKRNRSHITFWERYFEAMGASIDTVDRVTG
jgi:hypothetical protein